MTNRAERHQAKVRLRLRKWCLAHCRFGLEQPRHYRAMFES